MTRPSVKVRPKIWKEMDGSRIPGFALFSTKRLVIAHLTPAEAIQLANELIDRVEQHETETTEQEEER